MSASYSPAWMPRSLRHPVVGFLVAIVLQAIAVATDVVLVGHFPQFGMSGLLSILAVALVAIGWGAPTSLLATLVGLVLLDFFLFMPITDWLYHPGRTVAEYLVFVAVGIIITISATQLVIARRAAEKLAASLAAEKSRTRDALNALLQMAEAMMLEQEGGDPGESSYPGGAQLLMERLAVLTRSVVGCQRVTMVSVGPDGDRCAPIATIGLEAGHEVEWWLSWQQGERRLSDQLSAAEVADLRRGETVTIDSPQPLDVGQRARTTHPLQLVTLTSPAPNSPTKLFGTHELLLAPLMLRGALVGVLALDYDTAANRESPEGRALVGATARLSTLVIERDRLEYERAQAQASAMALRVAKERMDAFLDDASHEIKNPVHTINLTIQTLEKNLTKQGEEDPATAQVVVASRPAFQRIYPQIRRLTRLANDLLEGAGIQGGVFELRKLPADLADIVREVIADEQLAWPERAINAALPSTSVPIIADADRIYQVVSNYLTNALKYSPADQPVWVSLQIVGNQARCEVRDAGPGLPLEEQSLVWQRFHRAPGVEAAKGRGKGLGLGLYISRTIIERHNGAVGLSSTVGRGSTFSFTLPLAAPAPPPPPSSTTTPDA